MRNNNSNNCRGWTIFKVLTEVSTQNSITFKNIPSTSQENENISDEEKLQEFDA